MLPKIESKLFNNDFYEVKGVNTQTPTISFIGFQSSPNANSNFGTISLNLYNKTFNLKQLKITVPIFLNFNDIKDVYLVYQQIKIEINKEYFKKITDLGEQHRNIDLKFDITNRQLNKGNIIIPRLLSASNYIATQGRIGPAQWIVSNKKTYNFFLSYLKDNLSYDQNNNLIIGNMKWIINNFIDDDIALLGRKNKLDGPGASCFFLTDDKDNIIFTEIINSPYSRKRDFIIHYAVEDFGNQSYLQYFKINTKDISYYRYKKLLKIKELSNE
jgi:hypothetical protein